MQPTTLCPLCHRSYSRDTLFCPEDGAPLSGSSRGVVIGPGTKVGEYVIEKKLGEGGMGEVWSAKQPQIGKKVAIKLLSQKLTSNSQAVARFVQEARAVNEIGHRNIVDIFSFGELSDGRPYFVMEFLPGRSLADHIKEKGPLPFSEILPIFEQVCSALQAGHELRIIHRDLKPDNLFLVEGKRAGRGEPPVFVKILDFGIAKLNAPEGESLTGTGAMMGTPAYMSPEQCDGAKVADHASDIYSLGVILFELLTGRTPFREPGEGIGVIVSRQMFMPAPSPSALVSERSIPPEVDAVVLKALAKNPTERYASCLDFYEALATAVGGAATETFASIQGASPLYLGQMSTSEPLGKLISEELAKKTPTHDAHKQTLEAREKSSSTSRTGDFYSGSSDSKPELAPPAPLKKSSKITVAGVASAVVLGLGVVFFSSSKNAPQTTSAKSIPTPTIEQPASIPAIAESMAPQKDEAPASVPASLPQPIAAAPKIPEKPASSEKPGDKKLFINKTTKPEPTQKPKDNKKEPEGPKLIFDNNE